MRYAIVSDIHANWQAWYAVREDLRTQLADVVICLGDVVGYGPNPQGVLNDVRQCCDSVLMGNHEAAAIGQLDLEIFNPVARRAAEWTTTQLDEEAKSYLGQLPLVMEDGDLLFVHAEPVAPDAWGYVETAADAQACFQATDKRVVFVGHTHLPEVFSLRPDGQVTQTQPVELTLEAGARYLVNVGSVGEPRDGSAVASYCVFDDATQQLFFRRVEFNLEALTRDIRQQPGLELPWFLKEHAPGARPETREHAIRAGKVATIKLHVRAGSQIRIQVGRNQKLTTTLVVAPLPPPSASPAAAKTDPVLAARQRRMMWIAGGFFALAASLLLVAALVYLKNVRSTSRAVVAQPGVAASPVATPVQPRSITLLAKDAQLHGAALRKEDHAGAINIGFWMAYQDYVSWTMTVEQAGSYEVHIVYAAPPNASSRDFEIMCGNARLFHKRLESTGDWYTFRTLYIGHLQLAVGVQELKVKPVSHIKAGLMNLREVRLLRVSD